MQVLILHNRVPPDASASDRDVLVQAAAVEAALMDLGHEPLRLDCTLDLDAAERGLRGIGPDCVFNLVESLGGFDWMASAATGLMDALEIPYTGNPTETLLLSNHKVLAKQWLRRAGMPTPEWFTAGRSPLPSPASGRGAGGEGAMLPSPSGRGAGGEGISPSDVPLATRHSPPATSQPAYLIKTVREHASLGIGDSSIIHLDDEPAVQAALAAARERLGREVFAERFIDGREFNLSVLAGPDGPRVLPPAEIDFSAFPAGKPRIVGYEAKWKEDSFEFRHTPRRFDCPESDRPLLEELCRLARACWGLFGLRGYARVDFRVDEAGQPWILEINTNPCLSPDAGFAAAVDRAGLSFAQAVDAILNDAMARS